MCVKWPAAVADGPVKFLIFLVTGAKRGIDIRVRVGNGVDDEFLCQVEIGSPGSEVVCVEVTVERAAPAPVEMVISGSLVTVTKALILSSTWLIRSRWAMVISSLPTSFLSMSSLSW